MRVILTSNAFAGSPVASRAHRCVHDLANALVRRGLDVTVVAARGLLDPPPLIPTPSYRLVGARFPVWSGQSDAWSRPFGAVAILHSVEQLLSTRAPCIVHGNGDEAVLIARLRRKHAFGFVMTSRSLGEMPLTTRRTLSPRSPERRQWRAQAADAIARARTFALGVALSASDRWCPTTDKMGDRVARLFELDRQRMCVVPDGIAAELLDRPRESRAECGPVVFFGRFSRRSGVLDLVEALGRLRPHVPDAAFVGHGQLEPAIRRRLAALGLESRVRMIPDLDPSALAQVLAQASVVALPWRESGSGSTVLEAMAAGAPTITTRVDASGSAWIEHERTGLLVEPGNIDALAAAIENLRGQPTLARALGTAARLGIRGRHTWDAAADKFVELYREVLPV